MPGFNFNRTTEDVKRALTTILMEVKDPRVSGLVSIVNIDLSKDLSLLKVYVSNFGGPEQLKESVKGLQSAAGFIKRELAGKVKLRKMPEIKFIADNSISRSAEINRILEDIKTEHKS